MVDKNQLFHIVITKFLTRFFNDVNYRILWLEQLLFSVILGASLHSWPVFCLMFLGLSWVLNKPKGLLYLVYVLSFIWGLAAMFVVYWLSGLGWAVVSGGLFFAFGLSVHFRDLKLAIYESKTAQNNNVEYEEKWFMGRQNLN